MPPTTLKTHTDRQYDAQLDDLRARLVDMARRVEEMIANSVRALVNRDAALAKRTIEDDHQVNRCEVEADELCLLILAKRQPMASDLRFITLALKMVTDLERIGDLAVNICERAIDLSSVPKVKPWEDIPGMAAIVRAMVREAIDAFISRDAVKAQQVIEWDDEVDAQYRHVVLDVINVMIADRSTVENGVMVQSVAKWLERMADHATNIAEQVIFMVHGKDIRHLGKLPR
jgi:phosphate transport system protein